MQQLSVDKKQFPKFYHFIAGVVAIAAGLALVVGIVYDPEALASASRLFAKLFEITRGLFIIAIAAIVLYLCWVGYRRSVKLVKLEAN